MATLETLWVNVRANTTGLAAPLGTAGTLIAGIGVVATKMALDYDNAFTKIAAVSNASQKDIAKWREQVLSLSGATAVAPKELADALFFLASAGLKTSQIMPVLEASAKASASGLGETADVAKLTANVLNAYAGTGLEASRVTDILAAAVREGSADTDEFGTAIGRILPIASAAGVGFDNIAASLASLSNVGLDVNEGVTAMRGLLQALVTPTDAAGQAMKVLGLSSQDLLDSLQQDGLIATLHLLDQAARKQTNTQADYLSVLREIVPNVRALTGALGLTQQEAARVDAVFKRVNHSTGDADKMFKETADSAGFKLRKALNDLKIIMIELGDKILPVVVAVVEGLNKELDAWIAEGKKVWATMQDVAHRISEQVKMMVGDVKGAFQAIKGFLANAPSMLYNAGRELILGLWNGIKSMFSTVWNGLTGWVGGLVDHVKSFLHIGSPSKVFEEIGMNMMAGMDEGIRGGIRGVQGTLSGLTPKFAFNAEGAGGGGDIILQVDGQTLARVTRDQLVKLGRRNAGTGL